RSSPWRRCSPFSPPSSRLSLSIVATPIVPDAGRMTAPGLAENRPRCTSQFGGNRSLIGGLPLTPYRVAIPGTVPSATASPAWARLTSTSASPATTRIPSLKGRGLATPSFLPAHSGPCRVASSANGRSGEASCSIHQTLRKRSSRKSPVWITHLAEVTTTNSRRTRPIDRRGARRGQGAGDRDSGPPREPRRPIAGASAVGPQASTSEDEGVVGGLDSIR
ncbi:MAG: hypothetical protein K0R44_1506, partial [Thermomicrobiales bacterium]|nr:hypothetical protein [Thermomicrobiales bacterium]